MEWLYLIKVTFLPQGIINIDKALFQKINGEWYNSFFDHVMPYIREPLFWVPFYLFMILFIVINFRWRGWMWVLFAICTAMLSDYISSSVIKESFFRLRPCRDPEMAHSIRFLVDYCPISSSFTSSHAVNHFAAATFIFVTLKNAVSKKWAFIFLWAAAISYAQVYVGVHYPVDVICGTLVGIILGYATATLYNRLVSLEVKIKIQK